jgi:hypothetical protein
MLISCVFLLAACLNSFPTLKMEAEHHSEKLVNYFQTTRFHVLQDSILQFHSWFVLVIVFNELFPPKKNFLATFWISLIEGSMCTGIKLAENKGQWVGLL